jgi:transposase InsO family protein
MTDNGPCFYADRFRDTCRALDLRHVHTRIYTPRTNGKAERFIQTAIREWLCARLYQNSAERTASLPLRTHHYNWHHPHTAANHNPPVSRSGISVSNLLTHHS